MNGNKSIKNKLINTGKYTKGKISDARKNNRNKSKTMKTLIKQDAISLKITKLNGSQKR